MKRAKVFNHGMLAGYLIEHQNDQYSFEYVADYKGEPISLTIPTDKKTHIFNQFPAFFDGLLPEGLLLEALLKQKKIDRHDYLSQLIAVGKDLVGSVTVEADDAAHLPN